MQNTTDHLLLIEEVASECRAPIGTVRHWIRTGRLRSLRPGRRRLVRRDDLERFLSECTDLRRDPEAP